MKKVLNILFILLTCLLFNNSKVFADVADYIPHKMIVQFEQNFSSNNPSKNFSVIINDDYQFSDLEPIKKGTQLFLETVKVSQETRAKRNASVKAKITKVYFPDKDETMIIGNENAIVKFSKYEKLDIPDKAVNIGISTANFFVKNVTYPARFVKGVVQNKEDGRLKSGAKEAYEASPLAYIEKGEPLELKSGDSATLTFYMKIKKQNAAPTPTITTSEDVKTDVEPAVIEIIE